jgi:molybdopterin-guanine dinucleotide biosynthesis protein A
MGPLGRQPTGMPRMSVMSEPPAIVQIPRSVMIGSVGRNTGKTEFACSLIRSLARRYPVAAVKVTTIYDGQESCIHGDSGCGVCAAMDREWCFTDELDPTRTKDTSRMLGAGAQPVWWLRVRERSMAHAARELRGLAPEGGILIIESNGIRRISEPDLFFMLGDPARPGMKESAAAVLTDVDVFVSYDGRQFDFDGESLRLDSGRCVFHRDAGAIILAGGRSSRMGTDKRHLHVHGRPLVEHVFAQITGMFGEVLMSVGDVPYDGIPAARQVVDRFGDAGPMGAIASALEESAYDINFVTACDIPSLPLGFINVLLRQARDHQVVVPVDAYGRHEPVFAVYRKSVLPHLRRLLEGGERRVLMLYDHVDTCRVAIPPGIDLRNLNTKADYQAHLAIDRMTERS